MTTEIVNPTRKPAEKPSALGLMAARLNVEPDKLLNTLKATVFKGASNEELLTLVVIANEYQLNPLLREIHGFSKGREGGVQPIVGIDGWLKLVNRHPKFDGIKTVMDLSEDRKPYSCTCTIWVKGRKHPVEIPEYYDECYRNTPPWNTMPKRMLRHKAISQCARVAFNVTGIQDPDEAADTMKNAQAYEIPKFDLPEVDKEKSKKMANLLPAEILRAKLREQSVEEKDFCRSLPLLDYDVGDVDSLDELPVSLLKQLSTMDMDKLLDAIEEKVQAGSAKNDQLELE